MNKHQMVEKIQKLLALANSENEHEAKTAASMAQSLLTKYNLTMTDVESEPDDSKYASEFVETDRQRQDPAWKFVQSLLREFFFVEIVQTKKRVEIVEDFWKSSKVVHCYVMFGQPHNVAIAKYVRDFLMRSFVDLFAQYRKQTGASAGSRSSYYLGLFKGIHEQLKKTKQSVEAETGLVVVEDSDLNKFIEDSLSGKIKTVPQKHVANTNPQALNAGYEKGKNLSIARGLGGGSEQSKKVGETLKLGGR
jgi:hypothetical protein